MKGEAVTVEMFKIWSDSQRDILKTLTSEIKTISAGQAETSKEIKETNVLLREDIAMTKAALNQHITEYNYFTKESNDKFNAINENQEQTRKTLDSREGVYRAAKSLKWAGTLLIAGLLAAAGAGIYHFFGKLI